MNIKSLFKFSSKNASRLAVVLVISTLIYTTYYAFAVNYAISHNLSFDGIILFDFAHKYLFRISWLVYNILGGISNFHFFLLNYTSVLIVFFLVRSIDWVMFGFRNQ